MLLATLISAYVVFIPLATTLAFYFEGGALGAWIGAAAYIVVLSGCMWWRFRSERWRAINIFSSRMDHSQPETKTGSAEVAAS